MAHHHEVDFETAALRDMATLWNSLITVTTAVQFFETLGSRRPARLRKLHELPDSAILVDEAHAALPSWLWPQVWLWLSELVRKWDCYVVLASGSLSRFWEHERFQGEALPLAAEDVRQQSAAEESRRVTYRRNPEPMDRGELIRFVQAKPGPRIVILNTVQAAAMIAHKMREAGPSILRLFSFPTVPYQPLKLGICDPHCRACTTCPYTSAGTDGPLRVQC